MIVIENVSFIDHELGIPLPDGYKLAINRKKSNGVTICRNDVIFKHFWRCCVFLVKFWITRPSFISIPWLVLELWQFSFIKNWREIRKSEIPLSQFCQIPADLDVLVIPNSARMFLINCYWILQNARVTAFTISELLRKTRQGRGAGGSKFTNPHPD